RIQSYTEGINQNQFLASSLLQDAVLRNLQVLAESTQRLSDEFKAQHEEIEWHKISGLRNILVHDYLGIDTETVWMIIENELSMLKGAVGK
ncbi:MAG: HepT-like ribonuclease domain-containing protein, partial [Pseudomonadota bacterium]